MASERKRTRASVGEAGASVGEASGGEGGVEAVEKRAKSRTLIDVRRSVREELLKDEAMEVDAFDGAWNFSDDLEHVMKVVREKAKVWKRTMSAKEYSAALEVALFEFSFKYLVQEQVCDNYLAYGPRF